MPTLEKGASLTRSTLWVGVAGNHDIANADLDKWPDTKAISISGASRSTDRLASGKSISPISGAETNQKAFLNRRPGRHTPKAATFSFDAGNAHWTVLDSNSYT